MMNYEIGIRDNILTTYLRPSSGNIKMFGKELCRESEAIRHKIACVAQKNSIDTYLSLTENMMFQSKIYKIPTMEQLSLLRCIECLFCSSSCVPSAFLGLILD